ncbi:MAG: prolyl oligopeptidase family serine peptidase [Lysobacterales bacterium]
MKLRWKELLLVNLVFVFANLLVNAVAQETMPPLTLEQIMADTDWLGNAPENSYWGADNKTVFYQQKRQGSELRDLFAVDSEDGATSHVAESAWSTDFQTSISYNLAADRRVYVYKGDIYLQDATSTKQLTRTAVEESAPQFMGDGRRIAFQRDGQMFVHDPASGLTEQVTDIRFSNDPDEKGDFDVLKAHQQRLFTTLQKSKSDKDEATKRNKSLYELDSALPAAPVYMGDKLKSQGQALSPTGRWLLLVTQAAKDDDGQKGSMPNYVTESGYVETETVRTLVGRNNPAPQAVWLIDLNSGEKHELDLDGLPGIGDDPLADLRKSAVEIYVAEGEDREAAEKRLKAPEKRSVQIWDIQWSDDGAQAMLYVRAVDNKDRWIATVDFETYKAVSRHRISDKAWVNPYHIEHGWLRDNRTAWFLSEDHGYLGIYSRDIGKKKGKALVAGRFVVKNPALSPSGQYIYYEANVEHPGIYEIYRVDVDSGEIQQMTGMGGINSVKVSPDESHLLITHSEINRHDELYVMDNRPGAAPRQLTDTMSEAFKAIPWMTPDIVAIPSSHSDDPIYSKIYLPADHDPSKKYPAVMFVHGAGYTQNSDMGWPYYFREGMFHNMLTQHGYLVIDMDYRASEGYGRDWRTAIYRQMGHPELEDLLDGVEYIVGNYGVDRERIGIYGGSYGGFMTCMAMFRAPGVFKAGAALRSVTDWSHYNHGYTANILNTPDIDPEAYRQSSPIEFADGLEGALLLASGMQDDNVFFQDTVMLVQRLIELHKPDFEIAIYPLDPHGFVHADSWLDEYRRIFRLFETNLK